jgi:hypothetical protein
MYIATSRHPVVFNGAEYPVEWPIEATLDAIAKAIYDGQIDDVQRVLQLGVSQVDGICEYDMTSKAAWIVARMSIERSEPLTGFSATFCDRFMAVYYTVDDAERAERSAHQDWVSADKDYRGSVL